MIDELKENKQTNMTTVTYLFVEIGNIDNVGGGSN